MERDRGSVTAAFHGRRSAADADGVPSDAWSSSGPGALSTDRSRLLVYGCERLGTGVEGRCSVITGSARPGTPKRTASAGKPALPVVPALILGSVAAASAVVVLRRRDRS
jgi:hypothetical protein